MPKEDDRHTGMRENIWFPLSEHERMLAAMAAVKEVNKSNFIRTCVKNFIDEYQKQTGKEIK